MSFSTSFSPETSIEVLIGQILSSVKVVGADGAGATGVVLDAALGGPKG